MQNYLMQKVNTNEIFRLQIKTIHFRVGGSEWGWDGGGVYWLPQFLKNFLSKIMKVPSSYFYIVNPLEEEFI